MPATLRAEDALAARANPDPAESPGGRIEAGTELAELERRGDWVQVETPAGDRWWVDGRRLTTIPSESSAVPPVHEARPTPPETPEDRAPSVSIGALVADVDKVSLAAAAAVVVSALLRWQAGLLGYETSAQFLWDQDAESGDWAYSMMVVMLVVGAATLATVVAPQLRSYRRLAGGVVALVAAWWLVATFLEVNDFADSVFQALGYMLNGPAIAVGPWLALAGGLVLARRRVDS